MRPILAFVFLFFYIQSFSQHSGTSGCVSFSDLMKASSLNSTKMEELLKPHGFTLTAENKPSVIFSTDDMSMLTFKRSNDTLISIEYNFEHPVCASVIENEIVAIGFTKDFKWESGKSISHGFENSQTGIYIYKAMKTVDDKEVPSYVITILPANAYLAKKEKYKSNPRIAITEY